MQRDHSLQQLKETSIWDVIVIGGGATGLGIALDCTTRGLKTLLLEKSDFSSGTSSKSTKLIHGGVRYLKQLNFKLVYEAIKERKLFLDNAEGLSSVLPFVIPVYSTWEKYFLIFGLKLYELLSFGSNIGKTRLISRKETMELLPFVAQEKLKGGVVYFDGQFNDSQICVDLAITASEHGATILNYCGVTDLVKSNGRVSGVTCFDSIHHTSYTLQSKVVVSATGVFSQSIMNMDTIQQENMLSPSQGVHIVLDPPFGSSQAALMRPIYLDDRVIFVIPWLGKIVVGTTDTKVKNVSEDPIALQEEVDFLIHTYNQFSKHQITVSDVKSVFCGLRPLVHASANTGTASISREHTIMQTESGLFTIIGGKWTTYRKMAEQLTDVIIASGLLNNTKTSPCITSTLSISNVPKKNKAIEALLSIGNNDLVYSDSAQYDVQQLNKTIAPNYPFTYANVIYSIRSEMAQTIDDILSRRTRLLFLDAKAAIEAAPIVADILAAELHKEASWKQEQLESFLPKAKHYLVK
jgi:glycerol-3-phosphate dehydrogenase